MPRANPSLIRRFNRTLVLCLVALPCCITLVPMAHGGSGAVIQTPKVGVRNSTGLTLIIDTQWVDASGYRDVRVHVSTATGVPSAAERDVQIELMPNNYSMREGKFIVSQHVTLPQGATSVTAHIQVPQNQPWYELGSRVTVDGREVEELSSRTNLNNNTGSEWSEAVPAILVIDADAPSLLDRSRQLALYNRNSRRVAEQHMLLDIRALEMLARRSAYGDVSSDSKPRDMELLRRVTNTSRLEMIPPQDLPERWIGLTCFDLIIVSHDDLQQISTKQPTRMTALIDWIATGGNLLIFDMGDEYEHLGETESVLALTPQTNDGDFQTAGWTPAEKRHYHDAAIRTYQRLESYNRWYDESEPSNNTYGANFKDAFKTRNEHRFIHRQLGMGLVVAMAAEEPFPGNTTDWSWLLNTIGESRTMWYRRHGVSLRRTNNDFWDFLVPNTGKAPIIVFCALITLFAVVIGPVNYFILARQRRLYLLLVTIPCGAALVTFCLIAYAVLADGLGTQVRVRSYTLLDQNSGRAVNWSRQSYYSGIAPARGLTFPDDTAVYHYEQYPKHEDSHNFQRSKVFQWNSDAQQNLSKGYLSSRDTAQFLTVRTGESSASLQIDRRVEPTNVRNRLGGEIELLLLCDAEGNCYVGHDTPDGEKIDLSPAVFADVKDELQQILLAARPARPEGLNPSQFDDWNGPRYYYNYLLDDGLSDPRLATSLLEDRIRRIRNVQEKDLAHASYIAIVKSNSFTPLGVRSRENGSLHVVEVRF